MLLLSVTWQCAAQSDVDPIMGDKNIIKEDSQKIYATTKDTFPKGRIGLKPNVSDNYNYLFAFYDKDGKLLKEITDKDLPDYSKFQALDFPRIREEHGELINEKKGGLIKYNLNDFSLEKRKEVLQKAGVTEIPDSVIRRASDITYFGNRTLFNEGDKFIITTGVTRFFDEKHQDNIYTCWDQTHVTIFDSYGNVFQQLDINHSVSRALISDDGRYLFAMFNAYKRYDADTYDIPFQLFDFQTNQVGRIDISEVYHSIHPLNMLYADSFFQVLLGAGPEIIHLLINPIEKKIYYKFYDENRFLGNSYQFNSMRLPDGTKVDTVNYQISPY